jgi:hypothetical protein
MSDLGDPKRIKASMLQDGRLAYQQLFNHDLGMSF